MDECECSEPHLLNVNVEDSRKPKLQSTPDSERLPDSITHLRKTRVHRWRAAQNFFQSVRLIAFEVTAR
jgi:hypothetical protein